MTLNETTKINILLLPFIPIPFRTLQELPLSSLLRRYPQLIQVIFKLIIVNPNQLRRYEYSKSPYGQR